MPPGSSEADKIGQVRQGFLRALPFCLRGLPSCAERRPPRKYEPDRPIYPRPAAFALQGRRCFRHPRRFESDLDLLLELEQG